MDSLMESIKPVGAGVSATWVTCLGILPELVSILVGLTTMVYLFFQIKKIIKELNG